MYRNYDNIIIIFVTLIDKTPIQFLLLLAMIVHLVFCIHKIITNRSIIYKFYITDFLLSVYLSKDHSFIYQYQLNMCGNYNMNQYY